MTRQAGAFVGLTAVVSFLLGLVAAGTPRPLVDRAAVYDAERRAEPLQVASRAVVAPGDVDFATVAARLNGAVVNVDSAVRGSEQRGRVAPRFRRDLLDEPGSPREGSGSGFIIDPAGYILTNYHVIQGADRLTVTLGDGRALRASVVGIDPAIDVALLHIEAGAPLPAAPLGRSDTLRVGEWVCAIGNPLGYVHSVTVGVVSFLGRKVFDQSLDALIQTDAAITFGNSGGPLINREGQVVGITTAISALASNIGFAVPIDQIVDVLPQLHEDGHVSRGFMGVGLTTVTPALERALSLAVPAGALVQNVGTGMPGDRAGLRTYDVVVAADDEPIRTDDELIRHISGRRPGTVTQLDVWRNRQRRTVSVKLAERPLPENLSAAATTPEVLAAAGTEYGPLGFAVRDLDAGTASRLRLPETVQGVLVGRVDPAGPARLASLESNQVVLEVNRQRVQTAAEFRDLVGRLGPGEPVALMVYDRLADERLIISVVPDS